MKSPVPFGPVDLNFSPIGNSAFNITHNSPSDDDYAILGNRFCSFIMQNEVTIANSFNNNETRHIFDSVGKLASNGRWGAFIDCLLQSLSSGPAAYHTAPEITAKLFGNQSPVKRLIDDEKLCDIIMFHAIPLFTNRQTTTDSPLGKKLQTLTRAYINPGETSVEELKAILVDLKQSIKNNPRNNAGGKKKSLEFWNKLIPGYVALHRSVNEHKLRKQIWAADPDADLNKPPRLEAGSHEILEDITDFLARTGDLPPAVLEIFRTATTNH